MGIRSEWRIRAGYDDHLPIATLNGSVRAFFARKNGNHRGRETQVFTAKVRRGVVKCDSSVFPYGGKVKREREETRREECVPSLVYFFFLLASFSPLRRACPSSRPSWCL